MWQVYTKAGFWSCIFFPLLIERLVSNKISHKTVFSDYSFWFEQFFCYTHLLYDRNYFHNKKQTTCIVSYQKICGWVLMMRGLNKYSSVIVLMPNCPINETSSLMIYSPIFNNHPFVYDIICQHCQHKSRHVLFWGN